MPNTSTSRTFRPAQSLSEEEIARIEFERDWERGLSIEDFRKEAKVLIREIYRQKYPNAPRE